MATNPSFPASRAVRRATLAVLLALALPSAAAAHGLVIGFTDNAATLHDLRLAREHAAAEQLLGAQVIRTGVNWDVVEPRRGVWDWTFYDQLYAALARHRLTILPVLLVTPSWAGASWGTMPDKPRDYAAYVAQVVARYGPGGVFWRAHPELDGSLASRWFDLWNEPYLREYAVNGVSPARYARLVRAAAYAGRAANPAVRFLLEADLSWQLRPKRYGGDWITAMYAAVPSLNRWFDAVSVHPYTGDAGPQPCAAEVTGRRWQFCRVQDIRDRFAARGAGDKPLWITEIGWATCERRFPCVTPARQAGYLKSAFDMAAGYPFVEAMLLYTYQDLDPRIPGDFYGLYYASTAPKLALPSFVSAVLAYGGLGTTVCRVLSVGC